MLHTVPAGTLAGAMMRRGGTHGLSPRRKLPQAQQRRLTQNR